MGGNNQPSKTNTEDTAMKDANIKTYSNRSNALRALRKVVDKDPRDSVDNYDAREVGGRWFYVLNSVADVYDNTGYEYCPHCGVHLSNGIDTYEAQRGDHRPLNTKYDHTCLGCGEEFGNKLKAAAPKDGDLVKEGKWQKHDHSSVAHGSVKTTIFGICSQNAELSRGEMIALLVDSGIALNSARKGYHLWKRAQQEQK